MNNRSGPPVPTTPETPPPDEGDSVLPHRGASPAGPPPTATRTDTAPERSTSAKPTTLLKQPARAASIPPDIGVWGPSGAGKTLLLAAALQKLTTVEYLVRKGVTQKCYFVEPEPGHVTTEAGRKFLDTIASSFADGSFPFGTTPGGDQDTKPFTLRLTCRDVAGQGRMGRFHRLNFMDVAGENTSNPDASHPYWVNLRQASGILFVLDGDSTRETFNQNDITITPLVNNFVSAMGGKNALRDKFLAVCITKADLFPSPHDVPKRDDEREAYLRKFLGGATDKLLEPFRGNTTGERRYEIFVTSGVGWCNDSSGNLVANIDPKSIGQDGRPTRMLKKGEWRTYHAVYPLLWLLDQIEEARLKQGRPAFMQSFVRNSRISNLKILRSADTSGMFP